MGDNELRRIFAENLRNYLSVNGYSQADMARYMHVSTATAAKWYTGQTMPRVDKIQSLCNWLGIEKSDLLEEKKSEARYYYYNEETARLAQEMFEDSDMRALFDMKRNMEPEVFRAHMDLMKKLYNRENHTDETGC